MDLKLRRRSPCRTPSNASARARRTWRETPDLCALLRVHPDLPILRANLDADDLRLIRSERINARVEDLLSAIQSLSMRR